MTASEILGKDEGTIIETAKDRSMYYEPHLASDIIEEVKGNSENQRHQFTKNLVNSFFTLRELYNKNVNGKVSHGTRKERMNAAQMDTVKREVFKYFPCIVSEQKQKWADCVRSIDKGNIYLFSVINKRFDSDPVMGYL